MLTVTTENKKQRMDHMRYLFLVFFAGCIIGWIYEEIFYWITEGLLRNRGILYGPWLPIYGIGVCLVFLLLFLVDCFFSVLFRTPITH